MGGARHACGADGSDGWRRSRRGEACLALLASPCLPRAPPSLWQDGVMARIKTTLSLDEGLVRQIRVRAARTGRRDSDVMEEVLREGLGSLERLRARASLPQEEALDLASDVIHEVRGRSSAVADPDGP